MKNIKKKPKPLESPRFLRFLCNNTSTFLGPFKLWNCPSIQLLHGFGSSWRYWEWGHSCPRRMCGEKVNPKLQMCSTRIESYIGMIILGLVRYRDGVREVQDGDGRFHGAWSASSAPGETPRSCQRIWSFFIMGSESFQGGAGSQYSLPGTWCIFVFSLIIILSCALSSLLVEITTHLCSLSLVWNSLSQCVCDLCVSFSPSIWFSCLNTVLVSSWNILYFIFPQQGRKFYCFCRNEMQGKSKPTPSLPLIQSAVTEDGSLKSMGKEDARVLASSPLTSGYKVWLYRLGSCQCTNWHFPFPKITHLCWVCMCWAWFYIHSVLGLKRGLPALLARKEALWI